MTFPGSVSWFAAGWTASWLDLPAGLPNPLLMGSSACVLLMAAEAGLSFAFGRSLPEHLKPYRTPRAALGLSG